MLSLQAVSSTLNAGTAKRGCLGRGEAFVEDRFLYGGGYCICVKWVPFVKLAVSPGNRAHFGSKIGLFSAFSHYVFNDCGPNRGFHSDFALSPILTL